jgi:hypothetical protein
MDVSYSPLRTLPSLASTNTHYIFLESFCLLAVWL